MFAKRTISYLSRFRSQASTREPQIWLSTMAELVDLASELKEEALPKLSMGDFRIYNSMADGMNLYVSIRLFVQHHAAKQHADICSSMTVSAKPGPPSIMHAPTTSVQQICPFASS